MGDVIPLPPLPSGDESDDAGSTTVAFAFDGQIYEMTLTEEEAAKLARDLEERRRD